MKGSNRAFLAGDGAGPDIARSARTRQPARRCCSALVLCALVIAACGSTVGDSDARPSPQGTGLASGREVAEDAEFGAEEITGGDGPGVTGPPGQATGSQGASGGSSRSGARNLQREGDVAGPSADAVGKGVTTDTISIGIGWVDLTGLGQGATILGCNDCESIQGSGRRYAQAVVDHLNADGGIAGRRVEPVYHQLPTSELFGGAETRRRAEQAMCANFTQDHQVFAMIPAVSYEGVMVQCAKRADTPMVAFGNLDWSVDEGAFAEYGRWWYRPNWMVGERRENTMVERLVAQGFFGDGARVGIMVEDKPQYTRGVQRALKPGLEKAGVEVATVAAYPDEIESPWESYVLRMRAAGVTHVVWAHCACGGVSAGLTMRAAENQRWRPRWALATDTYLQGVNLLGPPEAQLQGVGGVAWNPYYDFPPTGNRHRDEPAYGHSEDQCRSIEQQFGEPAPNGYWGYCESLFFLKFSLERSGAFTSSALALAVEGSDDAYRPVTTPAARFGPSRHDGADVVYDLAYDTTCGCFVYTGGPHRAAR